MAALPNEDEAAAIAAALERFLAETAAPATAEDAAVVSPWQRAALLEGVGAKGGLADLEGGGRWLS